MQAESRCSDLFREPVSTRPRNRVLQDQVLVDLLGLDDGHGHIRAHCSKSRPTQAGTRQPSPLTWQRQDAAASQDLGRYVVRLSVPKLFQPRRSQRVRAVSMLTTTAKTCYLRQVGKDASCRPVMTLVWAVAAVAGADLPRTILSEPRCGMILAMVSRWRTRDCGCCSCSSSVLGAEHRTASRTDAS